MATARLRIGRCGMDVEESTSVDPYPFALEGDRLTLSGDLIAADVAAAKALRQQLNGYGPHNSDEPVVPVAWDGDESLNGLYYVLSTEVGTIPTSYSEDRGWFPFEVELQRVEGYQAPLLEVVRNGNVRTNTLSYTNGVASTFLPGSHLVPRWSSTPSGSAFVAVAGGSVAGFAGPSYLNSVSYMVDPQSFYEGAATIEVSEDEGSTWRVVTGRQVRNLPTWVRVGNGRVRFTLSQADGAAVVTGEAWDAEAEAWEDTGFQVVDAGTPTVLRTYTHSNISSPQGIAAVASDSRVYWASGGNQRIGRSTMAASIGAFPVGKTPRDICEGPDGLLWFTSAGGGGGVSKMTTAGVVTHYTDANIVSPYGICEGPDGLLWFTSFDNSRIGKITTSGTVTTYTDANVSGPYGICEGPDGLLWFTSRNNSRIGKITTAGTVTTYTTGVGSAPERICAGPDGLLWYTRTDDDAICKITTSGTVTTYTSGVPNAPNYIASDGTDLWFTYSDGIGKITTSGTVTTYTNANIVDPQGICLGPDNNLWFTSKGNNRIGTLIPGADAIGQMEFGGTLTVLRNAPEAVSIRVGQISGDATLDLTLQRGHNYAQGYVTGTAAAYGVYRTADETGGSITGGITSASTNGDGNRYTILSPNTVTADTNGTAGIYLTSTNTAFSFAVTPVNTPTIDGQATITQSYFAVAPERQITSSR